LQQKHLLPEFSSKRKAQPQAGVLPWFSAFLNMASLLQSFDSCTLYDLCSFLDPCSMSSVEASAFDRYCIAECWKALRVTAEQQVMCRPWCRKPPGQLALPTNHKHALREVAF